MTHTAIFEKYNEKDTEVASKYKKADYVRSRVMKGIISGTVYYLAVYVIVVLFVCAIFVNRIDGMTIFVMIAGGILWLCARMYFHMRHLREIAGDYYDACEEKQAELDQKIRILGMMYDDEQARTTSWSGDLE